MTRFLVLVVACASLLRVPVSSHELGETSVTLTLRPGGVSELRLVIPYDEVLHRQVMPREPFGAFLVAVSAAPAGQAAATSALQDAIARDTRVLADGRPVIVDRWNWPSPAVVRDTLRRALMMRTAGVHDHPERLVVTAAAHLAATTRQVQIRVPVTLGPALVTVSRPREQWVAAGALSTPIPIQD